MESAAQGNGKPDHDQADQCCVRVAVGGSHRAPFAAARSAGHWGWENRHLIYGEVTLNGGNPRDLTLGDFVGAAYALMVRTYAGIPGKNLIEAIDLANESFGIEKSAQAVEASVEQQNQASLEQLSGMLRGTR